VARGRAGRSTPKTRYRRKQANLCTSLASRRSI
jgi:hypothetical protein